jgi:hypothetical protein
MSTARFVFPAVAIALTLLAARARAEGDASDEAIGRGIALRREHKDAEALAEFRRAYELVPTPRALAQVALAEAALERWVPAESDLLRALAAEDEWIDRQRPTLQVALKELQQHLSTLEVVCAQPAELWIDGALVTELPAQPLRVVAKHLVLEFYLVGFKVLRKEIDAPAGGVLREEVALDLASALRGAQPVTPTAPAPARAPVAASPPVREATTQRTFGWITAGGAALFLAGGVTATVYGALQDGAYHDGGCAGRNPSSTQCATYRSQVESAEVAEAITYSAAGASALASVALFLSLPRAARPAPQARAWCLPTLGGIACGGTY